MKNKSLLVSLSLFMAITISAQEAKYEIKSGIINSTMEVMGQKIETVTYFDDYGKTEATLLTLQGPSGKVRMKSLEKGDSTYTIDLDNKQGAVQKSAEHALNYLKTTPEMIEKHKLKEVGEEEISGKKCKKYTSETEVNRMGTNMKSVSTTWIWKGIPMKSESDTGGMKSISTVTKIQENATFDPEILKVPGDVKIQQMQL